MLKCITQALSPQIELRTWRVQVTYNTLIYSYSKAGHLAKGKEVFERMASNGCPPNLWTYNILLDAMAKYGTVDEAVQLYNDLKKAGHRPNVVTYGTLMTLYGRTGLYEVAEDTLREMSRAGCLPNVTVYSGLIHSYSRHGMYKVIISAAFCRSSCFLLKSFGRSRIGNISECQLNCLVQGALPEPRCS